MLISGSSSSWADNSAQPDDRNCRASGSDNIRNEMFGNRFRITVTVGECSGICQPLPCLRTRRCADGGDLMKVGSSRVVLSHRREATPTTLTRRRLSYVRRALTTATQLTIRHASRQRVPLCASQTQVR